MKSILTLITLLTISSSFTFAHDMAEILVSNDYLYVTESHDEIYVSMNNEAAKDLYHSLGVIAVSGVKKTKMFKCSVHFDYVYNKDIYRCSLRIKTNS